VRVVISVKADFMDGNIRGIQCDTELISYVLCSSEGLFVLEVIFERKASYNISG